MQDPPAFLIGDGGNCHSTCCSSTSSAPPVPNNWSSCHKAVMLLPGVIKIHSPHFWSMNADTTVGCMKLLVHPDAREQDILRQVLRVFKDAGVSHMTVQVEKVQPSLTAGADAPATAEEVN